MHGLLQPAGIHFRQTFHGSERGAQVPAAIDVDHQFRLVTDDFADNPQALHVLLQVESANLGLERAMPLGFEHLHLLAQLLQVLAFAVVGAGDITGYGVPVAAKYAVKRHLAMLAENVPHGDIHRRRRQHDVGLTPALFGTNPVPGQCNQLFIESFRRQRVGADDDIVQAVLEHPRRVLERSVAAGEPETGDPGVAVQHNQQFVRRRNREMADPVRALLFGTTQDVNLYFGYFHSVFLVNSTRSGQPQLPYKSD